MKVQSNELHLKRCFELCWDEICSTIFNKERGQPRFLNFPALRFLYFLCNNHFQCKISQRETFLFSRALTLLLKQLCSVISSREFPVVFNTLCIIFWALTSLLKVRPRWQATNLQKKISIIVIRLLRHEILCYFILSVSKRDFFTHRIKALAERYFHITSVISRYMTPSWTLITN